MTHLLAVVVVAVAVAHSIIITGAAVVVVHDWRVVRLLLVAGHFGRWVLVTFYRGIQVVARRVALLLLHDGMLLLLLYEVLLMA